MSLGYNDAPVRHDKNGFRITEEAYNKAHRPVAVSDRPNVMTIELWVEIMALIREGSNLSRISKMDNMPYSCTIARWRREYPDFEIELQQAMQDRSEAFADKMLTIGDDVLTDKSLHPLRAQTALNAIEKAATLLNPKTSRMVVTGANGGAIAHEHKHAIAADAESFTRTITILAARNAAQDSAGADDAGAESGPVVSLEVLGEAEPTST